MMRVLNQLIVLLCIGRCFGAAPAFAEGGVKVGVLLPLTGEGSSAYGEPARQAAFLANLLADAVEKCASDTACIRDFLYSVKDYPGVSGRLTFDDHGDVTKALTLKQIKDGKFVSYKP